MTTHWAYYRVTRMTFFMYFWSQIKVQIFLGRFFSDPQHLFQLLIFDFWIFLLYYLLISCLLLLYLLEVFCNCLVFIHHSVPCQMITKVALVINETSSFIGLIFYSIMRFIKNYGVKQCIFGKYHRDVMYGTLELNVPLLSVQKLSY